MKKKYIIPETDVIELDERLPLLAGSSINESLQDEEEIIDPTLII